MAKWDQITPRSIFHIAMEVRDGEADPEDVRNVLDYFCHCVDNRKPISPHLLKYLRDSFHTYLTADKTLESSLGLARKRGRPQADEEIRCQMAAAILRLRLEGTSHQDALCEVSHQFARSETIVGEAWRMHKMDAIDRIKLKRPADKYPWTPEEVDRLCQMFQGETWFIAPGNSENKPA